MRAKEEIIEKRTDIEERLSDAERKNNKVKQDELRGFIQAIDWICHQEQKEFKQ